MNRLSLIVFTCVAALLLGFSSVVVADTKAKKPSSATMSAPVFQKPSEHIEAQLKELHTALKITPQQESAWSAYADFRKKDAQDMDKKFAEFQQQHPMGAPGTASAPAAGEPHMSAIEMLQQQHDRLADAQTHLDALLAATQQFYAALTPEQQKSADDILLPHRMIAVTTPPAPAH